MSSPRSTLTAFTRKSLLAIKRGATGLERNRVDENKSFLSGQLRRGRLRTLLTVESLHPTRQIGANSTIRASCGKTCIL